MPRRLTFFAYGCVCYLVFLASFLYAVAFVGGFAVPTRLDPSPGTAAGTHPLAALVIDAGLLAVFAAQHSIMARRWFKERWTRIVPPSIERSTFVLFASLALALLCWQWQPIGGVVWSVHSPAARAAIWAVFAFGWLQVLAVTFLINHFDLFGLRQVWLFLAGKPYSKVPLATPGPYRLVRHPLYLGFVLAFWATPTMTTAHLVFAMATTAYMLLAIQFEERDLAHEHGPGYAEYRRTVPMILPLGRRQERGAAMTREVTAK